jgi:hypothetical protein
MDTVDITIVGAGVVGTAIAHELSKTGHEVFVIEKNPGVTQGENQSSRNAGVIHSGFYVRKRPDLMCSTNVYPAPLRVELPTGSYWTVGTHITPTIETASDGSWAAGPVAIVGPLNIPARGKEDFDGEFKPMGDYFEKVSPYFPGVWESDLEPQHAGVLAGAIIVRSLTKGPPNNAKQLTSEKKSPTKIILVLAALFLYTWLMEMLGFMIVTMLLFLFLLGIVEKKRWRFAALVSLIVMLLFGIAGFLMKKFRYDGAPMILALVLGQKLETSLRRSLIMSQGDFSIFISRPISLAFLITAVVLLIIPIITQRRKLSMLKES